MASKSTTERTIKTKLDGESTGGLRRAVREQERELARLRRAAEREQALFVSATTRGADKISGALATSAKGVLALGSAVGTLQGVTTAVAGTVAVASSLSGTLLALPGIAATGAAGIGVLKLATTGFTEALEASDAKEWTEATKDMAPAAVKTAEAIRAQNDRLTALRKLVQGRFFAGFDTDVRSLADKYFPILEKNTGDIAGNFNLMGRNAAKALLAPSSVDAVNKILDATTKTTKELEPALGNVLGGLLELGGVGAQRTVTLGKAVTNLTEDFRNWVAEGVKTGRINDLIDEGVKTAKDLGRVFTNLGQIGQKLWSGLNAGERDFLGGIIETTQAVEDFLDSVEGQEAVRVLGETLGVAADVARNVFKTAMEELAPIIIEIGPAVQAFAQGVGDFLVKAMQIAGPMLQDLARFLSDNHEAVRDLVPLVLGLAVAYKGLKVATEVKGWMSGLPGLFGRVGASAKGASDAIGVAGGTGLAARLGALAAPAAAAGAALVTLGGDARHEPMDRWERSTVSKAQQSAFGLRPVTLRVDANVEEARTVLDQLVNGINRTAGTVNINGNDNGAAFALRQILSEIAAGKESVTIDGKQVPAREALANVLRLIDTSTGTLTVNGNEVPASQVLTSLLGRIDGSSANVNVGANVSAAQGVIDRFITMNNGRQVQIYTSVLGSGGIASAGRLATGGRPFFNGRVHGPGTRTNDKAGLFALSRDEHVLSAAEVDAAGGHAAIYAWRRALLSGARGFADGGTPRYLSGVMTSGGSAAAHALSVSVAAPTVRVFFGTREFTEVVRTEIDYADRQKKRAARTGSGGAW